MANYLKKTKLKAILTYLGYKIPALSKCSYVFYRGSEWLTAFDVALGITVRLYRDNSHIAVEEYFFDVHLQKECYRNRKVYSGHEKTVLENAVFTSKTGSTVGR